MSVRVLFADLARAGSVAVSMQTGGGFEAYAKNPKGFFEDALGISPWEAQVEIAKAISECDNVSCRSGHGVGKSYIAGSVGLWFIATRPAKSIVLLTAPTFKQVQEVLWNETRSIIVRSKRSLGGKVAQTAAKGIRWIDGRRLFGLTATAPEAFAGIRAPQMLLISDESSGVKDDIFVAMSGNLAGGGKRLLLGNPTKTSGYFHRSHTTDKEFEAPKGKRIHIPSTRSPNVVAGYIVIPGLVTAEWVEARKLEWGEDSSLYKCRVLGEFVELEEGRAFTNEMIFDAERLWRERDKKPSIERLVIGLDPAGEKGDGDESAFAPRRGKVLLEIHHRRGLSPEGHVVEVCGLIHKHKSKTREERYRPLVVVDRDGIVGHKVYAALAAYQQSHSEEFDLLGVRGGERAHRRPLEVDRVRDEVWLNLVDWIRDGGMIVEDVKLQRDLAAIRTESHISGRTKIIDKDQLRKELGRSPDRGDALALSAWGRDVEAEDHRPRRRAQEEEQPATDPYETDPAQAFNPYDGGFAWKEAA